MNKTLKLALRWILWSALILIGAYGILYGIIAIRYSPEYVYRELFTDLGNVYDYRILPERKLSASHDPFHFTVDKSRESQVLSAFLSIPGMKSPDAFLESTGTQAFLVIQDDSLIYERYFKGLQRDSVVTSFSVAKSFDSALIGIAIQERYIHSADDPITDYLPELQERDPRFKAVTIRHLLKMTSGLRYNTDRPISFGDDNLTYMFPNLRHLALTETQVVEEPGKTFIYNNYNPLLIGIILERATSQPVTTYLQEKIWDPIGMEYAGSWSLDSQKSGFEKMESGLNGRAIDFAKLGRLYLHGGNWNGKQVVPASWVAESIQDNGMIKDAPFYYGHMWWGKQCGSGSPDFFAAGNMGQFVYVSPAKKLIIVRNGEEYGLQGEMEAWADILCQFTLGFKTD